MNLNSMSIIVAKTSATKHDNLQSLDFKDSFMTVPAFVNWPIFAILQTDFSSFPMREKNTKTSAVMWEKCLSTHT